MLTGHQTQPSASAWMIKPDNGELFKYYFYYNQQQQLQRHATAVCARGYPKRGRAATMKGTSSRTASDSVDAYILYELAGARVAIFG
jgi:hypothetical protein